ncbi:MAG TPA: hypothetical protein VIS74_06390, partial [Chthoniobacterales bacterium]
SPALRLLIPGFDEDGRVAFWSRQMSEHRLEDNLLVFEGFGNDLTQQWPRIAREIHPHGAERR